MRKTAGVESTGNREARYFCNLNEMRPLFLQMPQMFMKKSNLWELAFLGGLSQSRIAKNVMPAPRDDRRYWMNRILHQLFLNSVNFRGI